MMRAVLFVAMERCPRMSNDLRAQALLDQLASIEKATAPPPTKARRTALAAVVLTWLSMGMVSDWDPTAPGMWVVYSLTGAGTLAEYIRRRSARRKAERLLARHEELQAALASLQADRLSKHTANPGQQPNPVE